MLWFVFEVFVLDWWSRLEYSWQKTTQRRNASKLHWHLLRIQASKNRKSKVTCKKLDGRGRKEIAKRRRFRKTPKSEKTNHARKTPLNKHTQQHGRMLQNELHQRNSSLRWKVIASDCQDTCSCVERVCWEHKELRAVTQSKRNMDECPQLLQPNLRARIAWS